MDECLSRALLFDVLPVTSGRVEHAGEVPAGCKNGSGRELKGAGLRQRGVLEAPYWRRYAACTALRNVSAVWRWASVAAST